MQLKKKALQEKWKYTQLFEEYKKAGLQCYIVNLEKWEIKYQTPDDEWTYPQR